MKILCDTTRWRGFWGGKLGRGNAVQLLPLLITPTLRSPDGAMLRRLLGMSGHVLKSSFVK